MSNTVTFYRAVAMLAAVAAAVLVVPILAALGPLGFSEALIIWLVLALPVVFVGWIIWLLVRSR